MSLSMMKIEEFALVCRAIVAVTCTILYEDTHMTVHFGLGYSYRKETPQRQSCSIICTDLRSMDHCLLFFFF